MKEIIDFIVTYPGELTFIKLCVWCSQNKKTLELKEYQAIIIELVKEHNKKRLII